MIQKGLWQERTIQDLITLFEANKAVQALLLKGSFANPSLQVDTWSDVDVTIIVADGALEAFFPTIVRQYCCLHSPSDRACRHRKTELIYSLTPSLPVKRNQSGPPSASISIVKCKNAQQSRSLAIYAATLSSIVESAGRRNPYPSGKSWTSCTAAYTCFPVATHSSLISAGMAFGLQAMMACCLDVWSVIVFPFVSEAVFCLFDEMFIF